MHKIDVSFLKSSIVSILYSGKRRKFDSFLSIVIIIHYFHQTLLAMKKIVFPLILTVALILSYQLNAQNLTSTVADTNIGKQQLPLRNFVDTNNDGICDNWSERSTNGRGHQFVDANKDGVCDNWSERPANGRGRQFVDANNDGVCDRYTQGSKRGAGRNQGAFRGNGNRARHGFRQGRCCGRNNQAVSQPVNVNPTK